MTISMRTLPRFPARIMGGNGLVSVRNGPDITIENDYSTLIRIPSVRDPSKSLFVTWDSQLDSYSTISFGDMFAAVEGGYQIMGDSNFTLTNSDKNLQTSITLTAARTVTLPLAASVPQGREIIINDSKGVASAAFPLIVARSGADVLNPGAATSVTMSMAGSILKLISDGSASWGVEWVSTDFVLFNNKLGGINRRLTDKLTQNASVVDLLDFPGADPTGSADSTAALNAFYAAITPGKIGRMPPGTFKFTSALTWAGKDRIAIIGAGRGVTTLRYAGANTTNDLITFGDYLDTYIDNLFLDFTVSSSVMLTGGYALRFKGLSSSIVNRVSMDGQYGLGNLWHGIYFDGCQVCRYEDYETYCQRDGASVSGTVGVGPKALMHFKEGWMLGTSSASSVGIRIGGAFGGVYVDAVDCSGAMFAACVVDETLKAEANREVFFWNADFDAGHTYSLLVLHSATNPGVYVYDGCYFFSPVRLQSGNNTNHKFNGCTFSPNLGGDALRVDDIMLVFVNGSFFLPVSAGYAVNITSALHNVVIPPSVNFLNGGGLGNFNATNRPREEVAPFATLASAATTDLCSKAEKTLGITGTTTITAFGACPIGVRKLLQFSGVLTLTHNATSLILLGGANLATAAGMILEFVSLGSGNWAQIGASVSNYLSASVAIGSAVALTTSTAANVASITLTPGTWDVSGLVDFTPATTTNYTRTVASLSTTSATLSTVAGQFGELPIPTAGIVTPGITPMVSFPPIRMTVAANTTVYLIAYATFTVAGMGAWGNISARRVL